MAAADGGVDGVADRPGEVDVDAEGDEHAGADEGEAPGVGVVALHGDGRRQARRARRRRPGVRRRGGFRVAAGSSWQPQWPQPRSTASNSSASSTPRPRNPAGRRSCSFRSTSPAKPRNTERSPTRSRRSSRRPVLPAARVVGVMTLPPIPEIPEDARPWFRRLQELRQQWLAGGVPPAMLREVSMGMSGDFEVAVQEGATIVRVGTAIFGSERTRTCENPWCKGRRSRSRCSPRSHSSASRPSAPTSSSRATPRI